MFATLVAAAVLGACSAPNAPEAGNHLDTAPPVSAAAGGTTSAPVPADNTSETSTAPASGPTTTQPAAPVFVPPSTTLPDDPDLREAIRVRIAVEAEYRRQARAGIADAAAFEGLADPDTWTKFAIADLEQRIAEGRTSRANTLDGTAPLLAWIQSPGEIVVESCYFNNDITVLTQATAAPEDDIVDSSLTLVRERSVLTRKEGRWIFRGAATLSQGSCSAPS